MSRAGDLPIQSDLVYAAHAKEHFTGPNNIQPNVTTTRQAMLVALADVSGSLRRTTHLLTKIETTPEGLLVQVDGLFNYFAKYADQQTQWLTLTLGEAQRLVQESAQVKDPDLQLALLRLAGPRLEAALCGAQLLAAWVDFLQLTEAVLPHCPPYRLERLVWDTEDVRKKIAPSMKALASLDPEQIEAAASALPGLMGELTHDFDSTREAVQVAYKRSGQLLLLKQTFEMIPLISVMAMGLISVPPPAPVALSVGLVMGSDGVMLGTQVVVSAEWVETMRQLVQAGVIAAPVVGAAVRIRAGHVVMSQSHDELPKGVREALGEGPEVRGMRQTSRAGAGMSESPRHHVLPREHREWFEQRGFKGEMDIDQFCVEMEQASHEAIHGGGNWHLGRQWPGEWNRMIMEALREAEASAGRILTRNEILDLVAEAMEEYNLPMNFTPWSGR